MKRPVILLAFMSLIGVLLFEKIILDIYFIILILGLIVYTGLKKKKTLFVGIVFLLISMGNAYILSSPIKLQAKEFKRAILTIEERKEIKNFRQYLVKVSIRDGRAFRAAYYDKKSYSVGDMLEADISCDLVDSRGNFSSFNYRNYLKSKKVFLTIEARSTSLLGKKKPSLLFRSKVQDFISRQLNKNLSAEARFFARSLVLADKSLDEDDLDRFKDLGLSHILAISGLHLSVIINFLERLGELLFKNKKIYSLIVTGLLGIYGYIIGFPISLIRSLLMYAIKRVYIETRQLGDDQTRMGLSFLIIILINPFYIYNPGLWYSYSAVFGILYLRGLLLKNFKPSSKLLTYLIGPLSIQLSILPFQIYYSGTFNLLSILVNLIVLPFMGILVIFSFLTFLLGSLLPEVFAYLLEGGVFFVVKVVRIFSEYRELTLNFSGLKIYHIVVYFFILISTLKLSRMRLGKREQRINQIIYTITLIFFLASFNKFVLVGRINFIDVGQADAILLRSLSSTAMVDLGGNFMNSERAGRELCDYLAKNGVKKLDAVFLSHEDYDHMGNIHYLSKNIGIKKVYIGKEFSKELPLQYDLVKKGDSFQLGRISLNVVYDGKEDKKSNDSSMVIRARVGGREILLMGDQEKNELELADRKAEILKVSHHGSKNASSEEFLKRVGPKLAIISAGRKNRYGHPSKEVLDRLDKAGAKVLSTIDEGNIEVIFIGKRYFTKTYYKKYSLREAFLLML